MDEFEINMTYLIWSCLRNTQDFSTYRAKFKSKFEGKKFSLRSKAAELIGFFFNVDWNSNMAIHDHPFCNFMFLA